MSAHKFWDSDLRRDPSLLGVAVEYARTYSGDFEFMVNAQAVVQETGSLPLPTARAVLNCMRADPTVDVPRKPHTRAQTRYEADNVVPIDRDQPERYRDLSLEVRHPSAQRPRRDVRVVAQYAVKIKKPYGVARMNGKVLHRVAPEAIAHWHRRRRGDWSYSDKLEFECLRVTWLCGRDSKNPYLFDNDDFLMEGEPPPPGHYIRELPYCRGGCFSRQCDYCGAKTQLDDQDPPDTHITACDNCGRAF